MSEFFNVVDVRYDTGEHMPVLVAPDGSVPLLPAFYATSISRPKDSSSTMKIKLTSIKHLYQWAELCGIDLETRFVNREFLTPVEIDSLMYACKLNFKYMIFNLRVAVGSNDKSSVVSLSPQQEVKNVNSATHYSRLRHIYTYIDWLSLESLKNIDPRSSAYEEALNFKNNMLTWLDKRTPKATVVNGNSLTPPKGFDLSVQQRIVEVIEPDHPENPWKNEFVKVRNQLYLTICLALGPRVGETLKIKIEDVILSGDPPRIEIRKRVDDPKDKRKRAPKVKTLERPLPIGREWYPLLRLYIDRYWRRFKTARGHGYLFVSRYGNELSYEAAMKIFQQLRDRVPGMPDNLTQHLVRHAWNERFSESGEAKGTSQDVLKESRRFLMGWSVNSRMPDLYDRRFTMRKADEVSLEMQEQFFKKDSNE